MEGEFFPGSNLKKRKMINSDTANEDFYSTDKVVAYLKCHVRTVSRLISEGRLVTIRPARNPLITKRSVINLLEYSQQPIGGEP